MFGNGDVSVFGSCLNFVASLTDGRHFTVVIVPDEQNDSPPGPRDFSQHHGRPITPTIVRSYLPDYAAIHWRPAPPTFFGRTEERGTNGTYRIALLAGGEGPRSATTGEMRSWLVANVYDPVP